MMVDAGGPPRVVARTSANSTFASSTSSLFRSGGFLPAPTSPTGAYGMTARPSAKSVSPSSQRRTSL
jgi:hypothetical protein